MSSYASSRRWSSNYSSFIAGVSTNNSTLSSGVNGPLQTSSSWRSSASPVPFKIRVYPKYAITGLSNPLAADYRSHTFVVDSNRGNLDDLTLASSAASIISKNLAARQFELKTSAAGVDDSGGLFTLSFTGKKGLETAKFDLSAGIHQTTKNLWNNSIDLSDFSSINTWLQADAKQSLDMLDTNWQTAAGTDITNKIGTLNFKASLKAAATGFGTGGNYGVKYDLTAGITLARKTSTNDSEVVRWIPLYLVRLQPGNLNGYGEAGDISGKPGKVELGRIPSWSGLFLVISSAHRKVVSVFRPQPCQYSTSVHSTLPKMKGERYARRIYTRTFPAVRQGLLIVSIAVSLFVDVAAGDPLGPVVSRRSTNNDFVLALKYYNNAGERSTDLAKAFALFRRATNDHCSECLRMLALMHFKGQGVPIDPESSLELLTRAAKLTNALAYYNIGEQFYYGVGISQSSDEALKWFSKAADAEIPAAEFMLGEYCTAQRDYSRAVYWHRKAAEDALPASQYRLAQAYFSGMGAEKDQKTGLEWLKRAVDNNEPSALNALSSCYYSGLYVKKDLPLAVSMKKRAADLGNADAEYGMALFYFYGIGVDQNLPEAYRYLLMSSTQELPEATKMLPRVAVGLHEDILKTITEKGKDLDRRLKQPRLSTNRFLYFELNTARDPKKHRGQEAME